MIENKFIFILVALLVLSVLMGCQLDNVEKEVITAENDSVYNFLMENPEAKKAVEEINAKIESGELDIIPMDLSRDDSKGVELTPAGSVFVFPGQSVTLTGTANPNSIGYIFFWRLKKNEVTVFSDYTFENTLSVTISESVYGTGNYDLECTIFTGDGYYPLKTSNKVSIRWGAWHTFTPTYSASFSSNSPGAWYTFNTLSFPNSGSGVITYNMTGGYLYKVTYSGTSNGGSGIYVTGGYGANKTSGSTWTGGDFKFNAGGTAGYKATLNNLVFQRLY